MAAILSESCGDAAISRRVAVADGPCRGRI